MERSNPVLEEIAAWLVAFHRARITQFVLTLEGVYSVGPTYRGVVPSIGRADGETRDTLPPCRFTRTLREPRRISR